MRAQAGVAIRLREAAGLSISGLARRGGMHRRTVQRVEFGAKGPMPSTMTLDTVQGYARALGLAVGEVAEAFAGVADPWPLLARLERRAADGG